MNILCRQWGAALVTFINYIGVKSSALVQSTVTILVLAAGVMLMTGALFEGSTANLQPLFTDGIAGVFAVAILAIGLLSVAAPLFGRVLLVWIVDAGSFAVVIAYILVAVSFLLLRRNRPDMDRPFRLRKGRLIGWLALLGSLGLLALYLPGSPSALAWPVEWGLVATWFALGAVFYRLRQ
jgi:amino acid transporter